MILSQYRPRWHPISSIPSVAVNNVICPLRENFGLSRLPWLQTISQSSPPAAECVSTPGLDSFLSEASPWSHRDTASCICPTWPACVPGVLSHRTPPSWQGVLVIASNSVYNFAWEPLVLQQSLLIEAECGYFSYTRWLNINTNITNNLISLNNYLTHCARCS